MLDLFTNLAETANNAVLTLFRGLHIYSLYVMILVGGGDADLIARAYGTLCKYYYPLKGIILNGMKVDNYDDYIQPDFIADRTEFEFQLIASINVKLILKVGIKAGIIFIRNLIKNKKSINKIMENTLEKMRQMVDVSTIIGEPMVTGSTTLIPVSKVSYGFTSGGTDLPSKQKQELFGGGGGGGITITPVAFIVIENGKCRMMQINNYTSSADRAIAMIPELVDKVTELLKPENKEETAQENNAE